MNAVLNEKYGRVWRKPVKPKRQSILTRLERFWFAIGVLLFGLDGVTVTRRSLPKAPTASLKAVRRADTHEDEEAEKFTHY